MSEDGTDLPNVLVVSGPALPLLDMAEEMKPEGWNLNIVTPDSAEEEVESIATALAALNSAMARELLTDLAANADRPFDVRKHAVTGLSRSWKGQSRITRAWEQGWGSFGRANPRSGGDSPTSCRAGL